MTERQSDPRKGKVYRAVTGAVNTVMKVGSKIDNVFDQMQLAVEDSITGVPSNDRDLGQTRPVSPDLPDDDDLLN